MNSKPEVLAIIPARGGSKSIPHKNIRSFAGYPLIAYSIAAALQSKLVTRVIVSTNDEKIAQVAREYGAEVPFLRPAEISGDDTLDLPVFQHALRWLLENEKYHQDVVLQLRPTSPIRPTTCVDEAVQLLLENPQADSVRGVVLAGQNPYKMWHILPEGNLSPILSIKGYDEAYNIPRQDLPVVYWQTGHIDAIRPEVIVKKNSMSGTTIWPLIINPKYTVDIDTLLDWEQAERLVKYGNLEMVMPGKPKRKLPNLIKMVVLDFDGVLTDDRVWVDEEGHEMVAAQRSDALGLRILRDKTGIKVQVISREASLVVAARCKKMNIPYSQGVLDKASVLMDTLKKESIDPAHVIYVGNEVVDLPCFPIVGCAVAPANSHPLVLQQADIILQKCGGQGAIRELCDLLLDHFEGNTA